MAVSVTMHRGSNPWNFAEAIGKAQDRAIDQQYKKEALNTARKKNYFDSKYKLLEMERQGLIDQNASQMDVINAIGDDGDPTFKLRLINAHITSPSFAGNKIAYDKNIETTRTTMTQAGADQELIENTISGMTARNPFQQIVTKALNDQTMAYENFNDQWATFEATYGNPALTFQKSYFNPDRANDMIAQLRSMSTNPDIKESYKNKFYFDDNIEILQNQWKNFEYIQNFRAFYESLPRAFGSDILNNFISGMYTQDAEGEPIPMVGQDHSTAGNKLIAELQKTHQNNLDFVQGAQKFYQTRLDDLGTKYLLATKLYTSDEDLKALRQQEEMYRARINGVLPTAQYHDKVGGIKYSDIFLEEAFNDLKRTGGTMHQIQRLTSNRTTDLYGVTKPDVSPPNTPPPPPPPAAKKDAPPPPTAADKAATESRKNFIRATGIVPAGSPHEPTYEQNRFRYNPENQRIKISDQDWNRMDPEVQDQVNAANLARIRSSKAKKTTLAQPAKHSRQINNVVSALEIGDIVGFPEGGRNKFAQPPPARNYNFNEGDKLFWKFVKKNSMRGGEWSGTFELVKEDGTSVVANQGNRKFTRTTGQNPVGVSFKGVPIYKDGEGADFNNAYYLQAPAGASSQPSVKSSSRIKRQQVKILN